MMVLCRMHGVRLMFVAFSDLITSISQRLGILSNNTHVSLTSMDFVYF